MEDWAGLLQIRLDKNGMVKISLILQELLGLLWIGPERIGNGKDWV